MSGQIAEFWASLGFKIDPKEMKKVDKFLGDAEKRLKTTVKAKTEESKVTDKVTKAAAKEAQAKAAVVNADVAATKAIDAKTRATRKLTAAEREAQRVGARLRSAPFVNTTIQNRINSMFPAMAGGMLGARSQDRQQLTAFYRGVFDQAAAGRVGIRSPAAVEAAALRRIGSRSLAFGGQGRVAEYLRQRAVNPEAAALGRIGSRSLAFGGQGRVAEYLRQRAVAPEASALGRIGINSQRFKPLGSAFREYDERLDRAVAATRAKIAERNRFKNLGLMEQRMSHLGPIGKSPELRSMAEFYRRQSREALSTAREEARLKREGLRSEQGIERSRRRSLVEQRRHARAGMLAGATPTRTTNLAAFGRSAANHSSGNYLRAGGATGAFARYGVGSLPFIGGAYGFSTLNRSNQEAISTRLTTQAVVQSMGLTEQQGVEAFDWLRRLGQEIGFNYMDSAQDYNQFLSNSLGAGLSIEGSQDIFRGVSEYQTAMGVTPYRRKLVNNALNQILGKGVLSMEEVRRQMAESLPGTMSIFAEAYAEMIGSGETGQAALARFYKDVGTGSIESARIMPIVARMMSERAAPKIDVMKKTSIAEQGRFGGALADLLMVGSNAGVEQGFRNFWKGMTEGVRGLTPLVRALAGSFEDFTKLLRPFNLILNSVTGSFESLSKWSGISEKNFTNMAIVGGLLLTKWGRLGVIFASVAAVLEDISMGIRGEGSSLTGNFLGWLEDSGTVLGDFERGLFGVSAALLAMSLGLAAVKAVGFLPDSFNGKKGGLPKAGGVPRMSGFAQMGMGATAFHFMTAGLAATKSGFSTTTDQYRDRWGLDFGRDTFGGDLAVRTMGVLSDFGNALTFGLAEKAGEWLGGATFEAVEWIKTTTAEIVEGTKNLFTTTKDNILNYISDTWTSINDSIRGQIEAFHNFMRGLVPEWAKRWINVAPETSHQQAAVRDTMSQGGQQNSKLELTVKVDAHVDAATVDDFNDQFREKFSNVIEQVFVQYGIKE